MGGLKKSPQLFSLPRKFAPTIGELPTYLGPAIVFCEGHYRKLAGKLAHGLVRYTTRFDILGVVDSTIDRGRDRPPFLDAGLILDGVERKIPVFPSLDIAMRQLSATPPQYFIVGLDETMLESSQLKSRLKKYIVSAMNYQLHPVNGGHPLLSRDHQLIELAIEKKLQLIDLRRVSGQSKLHCFSGKLAKLETPIISFLGTDKGVGNLTLAQHMLQLCRRVGIKVELVSTGRTGWLQGHQFATIVDSLPADAVWGEIERVLQSCAQKKCDLIFLEGASGLLRPDGIHGAPLFSPDQGHHAILQLPAERRYFWGLEHLKWEIPSLLRHQKFLECLGTKLLASTLHIEKRHWDDQARIQKLIAQLKDQPGLEGDILFPFRDTGDQRVLLEKIQNLL